MSELIPFAGRYRRLVDLKAWNDTTVVGWVEDDMHHFGLTLKHDGQVVTDVRVAPVRYPWTTCPSALEPLKALIGQPLIGRCSDIGRQVDMRTQCTHLFDLAGLLSAHAFHRRSHHRYHATVSAIEGDADRAGWQAAQLWYDDVPVLYWSVHQGMILEPADQAGHPVERGFREWTESMDLVAAERASVLRRAIFVASARLFKVRVTHISPEPSTPVVCHSYQMNRRGKAERCGEISDVRRFDDSPEGMLALVDTQP